MSALRRLFNLGTIPGWVLLGFGYLWGAFGVWARLEFIASRIQHAWPFLGNAWSVISTHLTFENMLLFAGVIWIGVGVWRRPLPVPQPPVALTRPAAQDVDNWQYKEMEGHVWRFRDICSLPIPERERLKREKPLVWEAYRDEMLRRPQYVLPSGRRVTRSDIMAMSTVEEMELGAADPDVFDWYMRGQEF